MSSTLEYASNAADPDQTTHGDIVETSADLTHSPYYNEDFKPIPSSERKWGTKDMAALWISMSACIPTYQLASSLVAKGMNWWQAVVTITLGNFIVLIPMILNAHAGTRYGIPFPVYCRASFGIRGANLPALMRAIVACGWFGIQAWIGGNAIYKILTVFYPSMKDSAILFDGINLPQIVCFGFFWLINIAVIFAGINSIRWLLNIKAPLLIAMGLALLYWAYSHANGFGPMLSKPSEFSPGGPQAGQFWSFFFPALTGMVGFWATLALNIPDFSRYAKSQKSQMLGQALGLPTTMGLFSFIGVAVTSATVIIYGKELWDPVDVLTNFTDKTVLVIAMFSLCLATLATNIAANVVSPANDFAHVAPKYINFRIGGLITGVIGIVMRPWKLIADPSGYIFTWLIAYSALLGAIGGILIVDYFILRKTKLHLAELYRSTGRYWFASGVNWIAVVAFFIGILPCAPGFLTTVKLASFPAIFTEIYHYAWFISFGVAGIVYLGLMMIAGKKET